MNRGTAHQPSHRSAFTVRILAVVEPAVSSLQYAPEGTTCARRCNILPNAQSALDSRVDPYRRSRLSETRSRKRKIHRGSHNRLEHTRYTPWTTASPELAFALADVRCMLRASVAQCMLQGYRCAVSKLIGHSKSARRAKV